MVPSGSLDVAVKLVVLVGSVMVTSVPAFVVGAWLGGGAAVFTVTWMSSVAVAPPLSVTVILNTYTPATKPEILVVEAAGA